MKKWFMLFALMFCVSSAKAQVDDSPQVPFSDSSYADIKILERDNVLDHCCWPPYSEIVMTRYEFAVLIARLAGQSESYIIRERQLPLTTPLQAAAIERLAQKFRPELNELGVPEFFIEQRVVLNTQVNPLRRQVQFFVRAKSSKQSRVASPSSDVPLDHWAYTTFNQLAEVGIIEAPSAGRCNGDRKMTRYEFAVAIARVTEVFIRENNKADAAPSPFPKKFRENERDSFTALRQLINEFAPELQALGFNSEELVRFQRDLDT